MAGDSDGMKRSTALLLLLGTGVLVAGAIFVLERMQPLVLRGVAESKALRSARTTLTLRSKAAPEEVLAQVSPDKRGCFEIPLEEVHAPGELMLHAKRGRTSAVVSPVGAHAATDFVITLDTGGQRPQLLIAQADSEMRASHPACFKN